MVLAAIIVGAWVLVSVSIAFLIGGAVRLRDAQYARTARRPAMPQQLRLPVFVGPALVGSGSDRLAG